MPSTKVRVQGNTGVSVIHSAVEWTRRIHETCCSGGGGLKSLIHCVDYLVFLFRFPRVVFEQVDADGLGNCVEHCGKIVQSILDGFEGRLDRQPY
jgi:hypothetical protein